MVTISYIYSPVFVVRMYTYSLPSSSSSHWGSLELSSRTASGWLLCSLCLQVPGTAEVCLRLVPLPGLLWLEELPAGAPSLPPSLPLPPSPSLPSSLPPFLPPSLPPSLLPSLPLCLQHCFFCHNYVNLVSWGGRGHWNLPPPPRNIKKMTMS